MGVNDKLAATFHGPSWTCCGSPHDTEHTLQCENFEPPLTMEEIRQLRAILRGN